MTDELETAVPTAETEVSETKHRGRPKKVPTARSIMERDDFKSAVARAVAEVLAEARRNEGNEPTASDPTWMRTLAMEISQLSDQGTGRKRVAPEVLQSRQVSRELMVKLIAQARAAHRTATYRVKAKTLLADRVVEPFWIDNMHVAQPTIIDWDGIPNEAITPGGLVVHGGASSISAGRRRVGEEPQQTTRSPGSDDSPGLNVHHKNEPGRYKETRILGSIADPARQTV
jgi:hypothetical protein